MLFLRRKECLSVRSFWCRINVISLSEKEQQYKEKPYSHIATWLSSVHIGGVKTSLSAGHQTEV